MKSFERWVPILMVIFAVGISVFSVCIAAQRTLTNLENVLLQSFSLIIGLAGSFLSGSHSAKDAAREIIKPHARSAFRRLISLYESLSRVGGEISASRSNGSNSDDSVVLARLEAIVIEQLATADDALEDWNDIVPEDVAELKAKLEARRVNRGGQ
ncbi:MAG: hypothetical protein QM709_10115 [Spongiibacteraceae bacterium]